VSLLAVKTKANAPAMVSSSHAANSGYVTVHSSINLLVHFQIWVSYQEDDKHTKDYYYAIGYFEVLDPCYRFVIRRRKHGRLVIHELGMISNPKLTQTQGYYDAIPMAWNPAQKT